MAAERVQPLEFSAYPMAPDRFAVYFPATGGLVSLSSQSFRLLQSCRGAATVEAHAARACRVLGLGADRAAVVGAQLADLAAAGALVAPPALLAAGPRPRGAGRRPEAPPPITTLAIPTRNRPAALARAVASYAGNARQHGRRFELLVGDDSDDPATQALNLELLRRLGRRYGIAIRCSARSDRARFADALARRGVAAAAARFGLLGHGSGRTLGAVRNALLLGSVGKLTLQVDDDTVCRFGPMPGSEDGIAWVSAIQPVGFHFAASFEDALGQVACGEGDYLQVHEQMLGRSVGALLQADPARPELWAAGAGMIRDLRRGEGTVAVTSTGLVGDSGIDSVFHLFYNEDPATQQQLQGCERSYRTALSSRQVLRGPRRRVVSGGGYCVAANIGVDNRRLMVPFVPVQRGSDGVFGMVLKACAPHDYVGHLPWLLVHQPPEDRPAPPEARLWRSAAASRCADLLIRLIASFHQGWPAGSDVSRNLRALGAFLSEAARRSDVFEERLRVLQWEWLAWRIAEGERRLRDAPEAGPFWKDGVKAYVAALRLAMTGPDLAIASDLAAVYGRAGARATFRRIVRGFGELLAAWPDMVAAARELEESDAASARRVTA